jgi:hypothetical protein
LYAINIPIHDKSEEKWLKVVLIEVIKIDYLIRCRRPVKSEPVLVASSFRVEANNGPLANAYGAFPGPSMVLDVLVSGRLRLKA